VRILQLTSDWKWTGPAAPMVQLAAAQRDAGHDVALACAPAPPETEPSLRTRACEAGFAPVLELERSRGVHPLRDRADAARLRALLAEREFDVVHTWHTRDHVLALRAAAPLRRAGRTRVVRSYKLAEPIPAWPWNRWLFGPGSDALACVSQAAAEANRRLRGGRPVGAIYGAVDLARFAPAPRDPAVRASLGLDPEHRVIGIVARAQRHRRFDLLLDALALIAKPRRARAPGRGRAAARTSRRPRCAPAARLGIADRVVFAGYRTGRLRRRAALLRRVHVSRARAPDGGCRALLEAAACAIPAVTVAARRAAGAGRRRHDRIARRRGAPKRSPRRGRRCSTIRAADRGRTRARARAEREWSPERLAASVDALYAAIRYELGRIVGDDARLDLHELAVQAALRHQLLVIAELRHASVFEHDDLVRCAHGREPVRDHEHGAARDQLLDRVLHQALALGVERAGRLVEHQDRRVAQDRARDRHALALAAREARAARTDLGLEAVGQRVGELVDVRRARGREDLLVARIEPPVADVLADRAVEQEWLLRDDRDWSSSEARRAVAQVDAVDGDPPIGRIVEAQQQIDERRLARAGAPDDRHDLARARLEARRREHRARGRR
jgi:glycosyltransferase involved in cell wall biosynthesis